MTACVSRYGDWCCYGVFLHRRAGHNTQWNRRLEHGKPMVYNWAAVTVEDMRRSYRFVFKIEPTGDFQCRQTRQRQHRRALHRRARQNRKPNRFVYGHLFAFLPGVIRCAAQSLDRSLKRVPRESARLWRTHRCALRIVGSGLKPVRLPPAA